MTLSYTWANTVNQITCTFYLEIMVSLHFQQLKSLFKLMIKAKTYYIRNILHMKACYSSFISE